MTHQGLLDENGEFVYKDQDMEFSQTPQNRWKRASKIVTQPTLAGAKVFRKSEVSHHVNESPFLKEQIRRRTDMKIVETFKNKK